MMTDKPRERHSGSTAPTRRDVVIAAGAASLLAASVRTRPAAAATGRPDVIVVGAGVFGAWSAEQLRRAGKSVLLVDAFGPAHSRASSGGESRMIRAGYGRDAIYSRMAMESLAEWKTLSRTTGLPIFHETGVLFFSAAESDYTTQSMAVMQQLGLAARRFSRGELQARWPQAEWSDILFGDFEPEFGALMARRAVQSLVANFVRAGGSYRQAAITPPRGDRLTELKTLDGETLAADQYVFACGPWLPKLLPELLAPRMFVTRQAIAFFAPPAGDASFAAGAFPGWADMNGNDLCYGFPDLEARGFKIAIDTHGPIVDPDQNVRIATDDEIDRLRSYLARRFPKLAKAQMTEARICQYENSANGDFLIDRHPQWGNAVMVGMGSGHGFKHGPAVGARVTDLVTGRAIPDARFSLATKSTEHNRSVI